MSISEYSSWLGRTRWDDDIAAAQPLTRLAAMLNHAHPPWRTGEVPPLGHWLYFLSTCLQQDLAGDGHEPRGSFLPPVKLPYRMRAGGRVDFHSPIRIGEPLRRQSTVESVETKSGGTGPLVFVSIRHEITADSRPVLTEVEEVVYRQGAGRGDAVAASTQPMADGAAEWRRSLVPDPLLLFRFSALNFNAHRIHYDRTYCTEVESYPSLVVHGPLLAVLLMDLYLDANPDRQVSSFSYRARRPVFEGRTLDLCGRAPSDREAELWVLDDTGDIAVKARLSSQ